MSQESTNTAVAICSNAMLKLGADAISSFDEGDVTGSNIERVRLAANLWPTVRRQTLRAHMWNCAIKRVLLSPDAVGPAFGFGARFMRPIDWLRTLQVGADERDLTPYRMEGRHFLADVNALPLVYVFDNDNPATWDAALVGVMELAMQHALCYPVTKSTALRDTLADELRMLLQQAKAIDSIDEPPQTLGDFPLYNSRFGPFNGFVR